MNQKIATQPVKTPEIRVLGKDEIQIIRTKDGELKLFKSMVQLGIADGTLVRVPGMGRKERSGEWIQTFLVSGEGYKRQAEAASVQCVNTPHVAVNGKLELNPYPEKDADGNVRRYHCRAVALGFTKMGFAVASVRTAVYDLPIYRIIDLLAKAKDFPDDFQIVPRDFERPSNRWAQYTLDEDTKLQCNTAAIEYINWHKSIMNRMKKSAETVQTFAWRNAIKHHPNITFHKSEGLPTAAVECFCWRPTKGVMRWDMSALDDLLEKIDAIADSSGQVAEVDGEQVQITAGTDQVHDAPEEVALVDAENAAPDDLPDDPSDEPQEGQPSGPSRAEKLVQQIKMLAAGIKPAEFENMCGDAGIDVMGEPDAWLKAPEAKLIALHTALSKVVDSKVSKKK